MGMTERLIKEELRSVCKCPEKFQLLDFGGTAFGIFLIIDSIRRMEKGENGFAKVELGMGAIMSWIHIIRFFYSDEFKDFNLLGG